MTLRGPGPRSMADVSGPKGYISHGQLDDAIETAIALGQPLLLTGDPGCGKTEVGDFVAERRGLGTAIKLAARSQMTSRDLFYSYDTVGRFHAANLAQRDPVPDNPVRYIEYVGLGRASVLAIPPDTVAKWLPPSFGLPGRARAVVLIDEIDKAPRDVPNDLLRELETMAFRIPELQTVIAADPHDLDHRPILVITSNSEKALPDAFLRRCIYYDIPFPTGARLEEILTGHFASWLQGQPSELVRDAVRLLEEVHKGRLR